LRESAEEGDLWKQVRAFEELRWSDAKRELLLGYESQIMESGELLLIRELAKAKSDSELVLKTVKEISDLGVAAYFRVTEVDEDQAEDTELPRGSA
jgi:hypothetical protein